MRVGLDFDFQTGGVVRLTHDIQSKLDQLSTSEQQHLYQGIARYLQKTINRRLDNQVDAKERPFLHRKHRLWNGKKRRPNMLLGMKRTQLIIKNGQVMLGYEGGRAALAKWHNEGKTGSDGQRRPQRQWLDLSKPDIEHINQLITRHLSNP